MNNQSQNAYPVDLQVHSTASDGTESPSELVAHAARRGVKVLALTDHDSIGGVDEAIATGKEHGVQIVPAIEFSTDGEYKLDFLDINILGYGIRHHDPLLTEMLDKVVQSRVAQKIRQVERLQLYGVDVPVEAVMAVAQGVPGRVHIAQVALERNPDKFTSIDDVFAQYLASNAPNSTYVKRAFSLTVPESIELVQAVGGVAVLAHPGSYTRVRDIDDLVRRLADVGLDGLEVRYTYAQNRGHRGASAAEVAAVIAHFDGLAEQYGLLKTGGSDYHGTMKPGIVPGMAGLTWDEWEPINMIRQQTWLC
ncbi:MAG: PHP domain-containing protein [Chloroflexota bacterium]